MPSFATNPDLLKWAFSVAIPAVSGFLGVVAGAWLTAKREKAQRRYTFREKQLQEFYSPLLGLRAEIRVRSDRRKEIHAVADSEWQRLCAEARQRSDPEDLVRLERNRWKEFEAVIDYDDRQLAQELVPATEKCSRSFATISGSRNPKRARTLMSSSSLWICGIDGLPRASQLRSCEPWDIRRTL